MCCMVCFDWEDGIFCIWSAFKKTGWCRGLKSCWRSQGNIMSHKSSIVKFFLCVSGVSVLVLDSVSVFVDVSVFVLDVKVIV